MRTASVRSMTRPGPCIIQDTTVASTMSEIRTAAWPALPVPESCIALIACAVSHGTANRESCDPMRSALDATTWRRAPSA